MGEMTPVVAIAVRILGMGSVAVTADIAPTSNSSDLFSSSNLKTSFRLT